MKTLDPPTEEKIIGNWKRNGPVVSVTIITYNHGNFIEAAIRGALAQITDFPIEIIIYDDASTDNSQDIIKQYACLYPKIINSLLQQDNQWQKYGINGTVAIAWTNAKGNYISWLEGDDYWTDPLKLQKQLDFLESHEEYSACFTNAILLNEIEQTSSTYVTFLEEGEVELDKIIRIGGYIYPTASLVFRRDILDNDIFKRLPRELSGDTSLIIAAAIQGKVFFLDQITTVYRRWQGGIYSGISETPQQISDWKIKRIKGYKKLYEMVDDKWKTSVKRKISSESLYVLRNSNKISRFKYLANLTVMDMLALLKGYIIRILGIFVPRFRQVHQ
jgi:glycosyltransferase involved in cell wall biosynthesis